MIGGKVISVDIKAVVNTLTTKAVAVKDVGAVMMIAARGVDSALKKHFRGKNQRPNKQGGPKQNFWAQIRDSVQSFRAGSDSAIVQVNDPRLNPHVFGATITPKAAKSLAIPIHASSYGVRAATFDDLVFLRSKKGGKTVGVLGRGKGEDFTALYVLVKSAKIPKDPTALPSDAELQLAVDTAVKSWLARQK